MVGLGTGYTAANSAWKYNDGASNLQWYLPAMGEMNQLVLNKDAINEALNKISGEVLEKHDFTWTSTQASAEHAVWVYGWIAGYFGHDSKASGSGVRPICAF